MPFLQHIRSVLCILVMAGGGAALLRAQPAGPSLEKLTVEDGLSQGYITEIFQDKEGFLWFGTPNGLNRYDGYRIKSFVYDPLDPYSISNNQINCIRESGDFLLIGTDEGLNLFCKRTRRFYRLRATGDFGKLLKRAKFYYLYPDESGQIWCQIFIQEKKAILARISLPAPLAEIKNLKPGNLEIAAYKIWNNNGAGIGSVHAAAGKIYVTAQGQMFSIDAKTERVQYLDVQAPAFMHASGAVGDTLWYHYVNFIGRLSGTEWTQWETDFNVRALYYLEDAQAILALADERVLRFDASDLAKKQLRAADAGLILFAERGKFTSAFRDRSGLLWFGTNAYGLLKYAPSKNRFKTYFRGISVQNPLLVDAGGNIGFYRGPQLQWALSSPEHLYYKTPGYFQEFSRLYTAPTGRHWLLKGGTDKLTLFRQTENRTDWTPIANLPGLQSYSLVHETDAHGNFWVSYNRELFRVEPRSRQTRTFSFADQLPEISRITALQQTRGGVWWIGTNRGLLQATPDSAGFRFKLFQAATGVRQSIQNNYIASLLADPQQDHILWIGTRGGGMSRLDTQTGEFRHFNTRTGFPDNVVYGILADEEGLLWMSTNRGLIRLEPETGAIKQYTVKDGLPSNEFNGLAYAKRPDGTLLFGSVEGLVAFNPKGFTDNPVTPRVVLTGLYINNNQMVFGDSTGLLDQAIEFAGTIKLPYAQNSISLELAALEFTTPSKNKFRYYLEGAEPEWAHTTTESQASYLNLAPGTYTFRVKASNSDGVWSDKPTALKIIVLPPWYRTWWAYLLYAFGLGGAVFLFYRYQLRQQLARAENRRLKELDAFKSRLYTNITHEFRTPLTVIQGMAGELEEAGEEEPAGRFRQAGQLIRRNSAALLNLINQLLDLAKLEAKSMTLQPTQTDLVPVVRYLVGSFESLAGSKDIELGIHCKHDAIPIAIDRNHLQTILVNLLSNAVKFTPANGAIDLGLEQVADWQSSLGPEYFQSVVPASPAPADWVLIQVRNSGSGIEASQLPHIFERFYQADHAESRSGMGSGIGLALVKELVLLMQGALAVRSAPGAGTEFVVALPLVQAPYTGDQPDFPAHPMLPGPDAFTAPVVQPLQTEKDDLPSLLIIEDNADVLQYIRACVEGAYQITTAPNGQQGIEIALGTVPDIIISDVMMPLKDGYEVVNTLKNDERSSHIPIVLLTARADLDSRIKGLERGADVYLAKPFDKAELLVHLRNLLKLRQKLQGRYARIEAGYEAKLKADRDLQLEDSFMLKAQAALEANMQDENFGVPELCRALGMSRTQLHRKMTALTGKSASHFIRLTRLQKARHLLLSTDLTVTEVSYEVGYRNLAHFSNSFAEAFGQPPSSLKK